MPPPTTSAKRENAIKEALSHFAQNPEVSIRQLSKMWPLAPRSTLQDRIRNRTRPRVIAHQKEQRLSLIDEDTLKKHLLYLIDHGFPPTLDIVRDIAYQLAYRTFESSGLPRYNPPAPLGVQWPSQFLRRHMELEVKRVRALEHERHEKNDDRGAIQHWFNFLHGVFEKHEILAENVYNMDETSFQIGVTRSSYCVVRYRQKDSFKDSLALANGLQLSKL